MYLQVDGALPAHVQEGEEVLLLGRVPEGGGGMADHESELSQQILGF